MIEGYTMVVEISKRWNLKMRTIQMMCLEGKIEGATKVGNTWVIHEDSTKPLDGRVKSGKYVKDKKEIL